MDVLSGMQDQLNPKNMNEFQLGIHFATLIDAVVSGSPYNMTRLIESSNEALEYWFEKYDEELAVMDVSEE